MVPKPREHHSAQALGSTMAPKPREHHDAQALGSIMVPKPCGAPWCPSPREHHCAQAPGVPRTQEHRRAEECRPSSRSPEVLRFCLPVSASAFTPLERSAREA